MKLVTLAALASLLLSGCVADDWISYEECVLKNYELAVGTNIPEHKEFYLSRAQYCLSMAQIHAGNRAALQAAIAGAAVQNLGPRPRETAPARPTTYCSLYDDFALCQ